MLSMAQTLEAHGIRIDDRARLPEAEQARLQLLDRLRSASGYTGWTPTVDPAVGIARAEQAIDQALDALTALRDGPQPPSDIRLAAWLSAHASAQAERVQWRALAALYAEHATLTCALDRPSGCWCLGLGGAGIVVISDNDAERVWTEPCPHCPEGQRAQANAWRWEVSYEAEQRDEAQRARTLDAAERLRAAETPAYMAAWTLDSYPDRRGALIMSLRGWIARFDDYPVARGATGLARRRGRGLYLWGPPGRGKTGLAVAVLRAVIQQYPTGGRFLVPVRWFSAQRAAFDAEATERRQVAQHALAYRETGLLVLDDLGAETATRWVAEQIFDLLNYRLAERLPTVITSNYAPDVLAARLAASDPDAASRAVQAARLVSRLAGLCEIIEIAGGADLRQREDADTDA